MRGLGRQNTGTGIALLAGYTALVISLWYAVVGGIFGILVALRVMDTNSVTKALFHAGAATSITAVTVFTGAIVGAGGGFVSFYTSTLATNPIGVFVALLSGLVLAVVIVALMSAFEGNLLSMRGCRTLTNEEARRISPLLQQLGSDIAWTNAPRFAVLETHTPNAWAYTRHIVLTKGLLESLDDRQLTAVIGHELHHWERGDQVGRNLVWACGWPIALLLYNVASRLSGRRPDGTPSGFPPFVSFAAWALAWPAWFLIKFPILLAVRYDMRQQEFEADAFVERHGYGSALRDALKRISMHEAGRNGWESALYATHPTTDQRIDRLRVRRPDDNDFTDSRLGSESENLLAVLAAAGMVFAGLIAWGAVINAQRHAPVAKAAPSSASPSPSASGSATPVTTRPPLSDAQIRSAESTASSFTTQFLDVAFNNTSAADQVVARYVPDPALQYSLDTDASTFVGSLYGADPFTITSRAQVVACTLNDGATSNSANIGLFIRWNSGRNGANYDQWFIQKMAMQLSNGHWVPTNLPDNYPGVAGLWGENYSEYQTSTVPPGYGSCP